MFVAAQKVYWRFKPFVRETGRFCQSALPVWLIVSATLGLFPSLVFGQQYQPPPTYAAPASPLNDAVAGQWGPTREKEVTTIYWPTEDPGDVSRRDPFQRTFDNVDYQAPLDSAQLPPAPWVQPPPACPDCFTPEPFVKLQSARVLGTYLVGTGDDLGISDLDARGVFAFPGLPGFSVMPEFAVHYLNGPDRTDLPARLYDAYVEFRWMRPLNVQWSYELAVAPGVYSDFEQSSSDALRITGRGMVFMALSRELQLAMGVLYIDRENLKILPAGGVIYSPDPDTRFELIFPRPKISRRYYCTEDLERSIYLAGEFGGGSWAIERVTGADDVVTYSDIRLIVGLETKYASGHSLQWEFAYVFDRDVEYKSNFGDYEPDDTLMLRLGFNY